MQLLTSFVSSLLYLMVSGLAGTAIFDRRKWGSALPFSLMLHVSAIIISGLIFHDLRFGLWGVIIVYFAIVVKSFRNDIKGLIQTIISLDVILFCIWYSVLFFLNTSQIFKEWDELGHWGPYIKEMYRMNDFYFRSDRTFGHKDYVPYITTFEYVLCKVTRICDEHMIFQGAQTIMGSIFWPLLGESLGRIKRKRTAIFASIICFLFAIIALILIRVETTFSYFHCIYADLPLGLFLGFGIAQICYGKENLKSNKSAITMIVKLSLILLSIMMTKMVGIVFVPVCLLMIWIIVLKGERLIKKILVVVLQAGMPFLIWSAYRSQTAASYGKVGGQTFKGALSGIITLVGKGYQEDYQEVVKSNYVEALLRSKPLIGNLSYISLIILGFILFVSVLALSFFGFYRIVISAKTEVNERSKTFVIAVAKNSKFDVDPVSQNIYIKSAWLTICALLTGIYYALCMYIMYEVSFSEYEALKLASYNRYMGTYIAAIAVMFMYMLMELNIETVNCDVLGLKRNTMIAVSLILLCVILGFDISSTLLQKEYNGFFNAEAKASIKYREFKRKAEEIRVYLNDDDNSIFYVEQDGTGGDWIYYNYFLMDKASISTWKSVKTDEIKKYEGDVWSQLMTLEEFKEMVDDYEYVYIDSLDEYFVDDYGSLFDKEPKKDRLYKVISIDGNLQLIYIGDING